MHPSRPQFRSRANKQRDAVWAAAIDQVYKEAEAEGYDTLLNPMPLDEIEHRVIAIVSKAFPWDIDIRPHARVRIAGALLDSLGVEGLHRSRALLDRAEKIDLRGNQWFGDQWTAYKAQQEGGA